MDSGQQVLVGTALAKSAELQEKSADYAGALATLQRAQKKFAAAKSVPAQTRNKLRLAQAHQNLGQWEESAKIMDGLVLDLRNMNNRPALVTAYALRGKQRAHDGKAAAAQKDLKRALNLAKKLGSPQIVANVRLGLCEFYATANEADAAEKYCTAAGEGFSKVGAPSLAARSYILMARLAQAREEWLQARTHYMQALKILESVARSARDDREVAVQEVNLCQVEKKLKSNGAQRRCLDARKALSKVKANDASYRGMVAATQYAIGTTASSDRRKQAIEALESAAQTWKELGNHPQAADALLRKGKLELERSATKRAARRTFAEGLRILGKKIPGEQLPLAIQLGIQLAQSQVDAKRWSEARDTLGPLIERAQSANNHYAAAWGYSALAKVELKLGNRDKAIAALEKGAPLARKSGDRELEKMIEGNLEKMRKKR
jgi:tetratricopeptide (TPR) repeat protein